MPALRVPPIARAHHASELPQPSQVFHVLVGSTVAVTNDVSQTAVVHPVRTIFGVPNDFVDEVSEVKHEPDAILLGGLFVLKNHSAVRVLSTLVSVLTPYEYTATNNPAIISAATAAHLRTTSEKAKLLSKSARP